MVPYSGSQASVVTTHAKKKKNWACYRILHKALDLYIRHMTFGVWNVGGLCGTDELNTVASVCYGDRVC